MTNLPPPGPEDAAHDAPPPMRVGQDVAAPAGRGDPRPVVPSSDRSGDRRTDRRGAATRATRRLALTASVVLVAVSIAIAVWATRGDGGDDSSTLGPSPSDATPTTPALAPATTAADTSGSTTPPATAAPVASVAPVDPSLVEVGQAVRFPLPDGYTRRAVGTGVEITNGRLHYYAQVSNRTPGESPAIALQEYVDGFDALYPSVAYTQVIPRGVDTSGVSPSDGYVVYYRVMAADGSGYKGVVDAARRADGLVAVTDLYTELDDTSGEVLPPSVPAQLYASFLQTPVVGPEADLAPLPLTRLASSHPSVPLDGVVAVTPPVGWAVDAGAPGRVSLSHPLGQRFVAARLPDTADPFVAQDLSAADLQTTWPGAALGPFTASRQAGDVLSYDAAFTATAADGTPVGGMVRIWTDPARAQVFHAISSSPVAATPPPGHDAFLLAVLDISLTQPR